MLMPVIMFSVRLSLFLSMRFDEPVSRVPSTAESTSARRNRRSPALSASARMLPTSAMRPVSRPARPSGVARARNSAFLRKSFSLFRSPRSSRVSAGSRYSASPPPCSALRTARTSVAGEAAKRRP